MPFLGNALSMIFNQNLRRSSVAGPLFIFLFCFFMIAISRGMGESYAIFLLPLSENFSWNRTNVTSIYSVYMLALGFGSLLSGLIFDRFGPRINYITGLGLLAGCYCYAGSLKSVFSFCLVT